MTQAELAAAACVSRQLVVAAEAGVNVPAADAAVRLARALESGVEELFSARDVTGPPVLAGALVVAGCDPALELAERMLARGGAGPSVVAIEATTGTALASLKAGAIHAGAVHGRPEDLVNAPAGYIRVHLARWQVGLGVAAQVKLPTLEDCLAEAVPIVQRQQSASSQQALLRAARALGHQALPAGALAVGHQDAARAAAALGCAAITTEGAAHASALRFFALEQHTVELWLAERWRSHPGFVALAELLASGAFRARAASLGGYDLAGCGVAVPSPGPCPVSAGSQLTPSARASA